MDLKSFYSPLSTDERDAFAKACQTTRGVIQNVMYGVRPCSSDLAVQIERHSQGRVPVEESPCNSKWVRVPDPDWPHPQGKPLEDHAPQVEQTQSEQGA